MFPDKHVRCGDWTLRSTTIAPIVDVYGHVLHMTVQLLQIRLQVSIQFYHISTLDSDIPHLPTVHEIICVYRDVRLERNAPSG